MKDLFVFGILIAIIIYSSLLDMGWIGVFLGFGVGVLYQKELKHENKKSKVK